MKKIYLFEFYVILQDGSWTLKNNIRLGLYDKRKKLTDLKRKGYLRPQRKGLHFEK